MKNLLTVLKKLGKKMTSQDINGTNLVTVVDDIANKYTGGSGGGGGDGAEPLICNYNYTDGSLDKTLGEIYRAHANGQAVMYHYVYGENIDPRAGNWASLLDIEFFGYDAEGYTANLQFANASFYTTESVAFDEALTQYPVIAD